MTPWARPGDFYIIEEVAGAAVVPGDVVLAAVAGRALTHRVVARRPGGVLLLKGDCNRFYDPPLTTETIIGRVIALETAGGARVGLNAGRAQAGGRALAALSRFHAALPFLAVPFYILRYAVVAAYGLRS